MVQWYGIDPLESHALPESDCSWMHSCIDLYYIDNIIYIDYIDIYIDLYNIYNITIIILI